MIEDRPEQKNTTDFHMRCGVCGHEWDGSVSECPGANHPAVPQTTNEQFDPRVVNVPEEAMFDAFAKGKADGRYEVDEIRFNEFQRGWRSALDFVNSHVAQR